MYADCLVADEMISVCGSLEGHQAMHLSSLMIVGMLLMQFANWMVNIYFFSSSFFTMILISLVLISFSFIS